MIPLLALACGTPIGEPEPLAFDRVACDHCGMLVSDPRFAAQLVTKDGERHAFDDPACAFGWIARQEPRLAHVWFHDATADAWLEPRQVAFVPAAGAPMDGGLAAVPVGTEGAVSFAEASHRVLAR